MIYRKELDGLRALAVIAVIIYHANLEVFGLKVIQGGFFGVDVFFVLSGYLITSIIRSQMEQEEFSFRDFYWRRAKRILPAYIIMLLVTSIFAFFILLPSQLTTYIESLRSALYFGSNHYFYTQDSYTSIASIYRPLLHTWSLSVEWQFYIVFPFLVWGLNKVCSKYLFIFLLFFALLSLQLSRYIVDIDPDMAFYFLITRAWELILGGLITFYRTSQFDTLIKERLSSFIYRCLPVFGILLVIFSMIFISHNVKHPSFVTLLPVVGTCLFIMFYDKTSVAISIFSLKPVVNVGLISYSLYLWHQPIFVFFRLIETPSFRIEHFVLLMLITLLISYASYQFIEISFRRKLSFKVLLAFMGSSVLFFSLYSIGVSGYIDKFSTKPIAIASMEANNRNPYKCMVNGKVKLNDLTYCYIGQQDNIKAIIVGDSHAEALTTSISSLLDLDRDGVLAFTRASCPFILNAKNNRNGDACYYENFLRLERIQQEFPNIPVFIVARWGAYLYGQSDPERIIDDNHPSMYFGNNEQIEIKQLESLFQENLKKTLCEAKKSSPVFITQPVPEMRRNIPKVMSSDLSQGKYGLDYSIDIRLYFQRNNILRSMISSASDSCGVTVIDPIKVLCRDGRCMAEIDGRPIYFDGDHLSEFGNKLLSPLFKQYLNN
ncbi:acyltransferase family protein [Vibrio sp. TBV020]|uniref:acyltransferase family protein n=1 Tax=Vibrio sp. TBV020 TaxID=3137398 RepID=UPI0038CD7E6F